MWNNSENIMANAKKLLIRFLPMYMAVAFANAFQQNYLIQVFFHYSEHMYT